MVADNALDAVQSSLITQYAEGLEQADSVIYQRIAEKSGLIAVNAFRDKFNLYLHDWFEALMLMMLLNLLLIIKYLPNYQLIMTQN
jgi:hypothetical protein